MADTIPPVREPLDAPSPTTTVRAHLLALSQQLRESSAPVGATAREELATLVAELAEALDPAVTPALASHLAETTAHLGESLDTDAPHPPDPTSPLGGAVQRLEEAASHAEAHAPLAAGLARRLVDAIAALGA